MKTFDQWLEDVKFKPSASDGTPPDLAFMIAPSCPSLLQRKLKLKNIQFIKSDKKTDATPVETNVPTANVQNDETSTGMEDSTGSKSTSSSTSTPNLVFSKDNTNAVNINTGDKVLLTKTFKGTRVKDATIDKLIKYRPYVNLKAMASYLNFTDTVRKKLQAKLDNGEIYFQ